jgi:hypothetical protein
MVETAALRAALSLLHMPSSIRRVRAEPLPQGVDVLLQILAGDQAVLADASARTERPASLLRDAAKFFVEQILLAPDTGSYRVLGASSDTQSSTLRHNMALLLRWLHPDKMPTDDRRVLVERVTLAWENLKTPERRAAYDARQRSMAPKSGGKSQRHNTQSRVKSRNNGQFSILRRALSMLFGRRDR